MVIKKETYKGINLESFDKQFYIDKYSKFRVSGINVLILIYKPEIKEKINGLYIPEIAIDKETEYSSIVGMVLKIGEEAYKGSQFPSGPYVKEGDWVVFPRASCLQLKYEDEPLIIIDDIKIKLVIDDPSKVSR